MKKCILKFFTVFSILLLLFIKEGYSQLREGYIINNDGDTTYGYINYEGSITNSAHCVFVSMPDSISHTYYPGDINGFRFIEGKYFTTEEIAVGNESKKVFIEWLLKGKASLLTYTAPDTEVRYFFLPEADSLHELINTKHLVEVDGGLAEHQKKEYVGSLLYYMSDCPSIKSNVEGLTLSTKPLIKLTKEYNERTCPGGECLIFEDKTRKTNIEIGPSVSMLSSHLTFNDESVEERAEITNSVGLGIEFNFSNLPLISPKFSISLGADYHKLTYRYNYENPPYYIGTDDRICQFSCFRIPIQLNYKFLNKRLSPYISAGAVVNLRLGFKEFNEGLLDYVTAHLAGGYGLGFKALQMGITPGCGVKYTISEKTTVNIGFDYEYVFKFFGTYIGDISFNNNYVVQASFFYKIR